MMDELEAVTDRCIRRGLGFAGLAIGTVMLALSFDLPLALRSGADLAAVTAVGMLIAAWHSPRRDMRHSEAWAVLTEARREKPRGSAMTELQHRLRQVLRRRLVWHAQWIGAVAVGLWALTVLVTLLRNG
jgi:hypothetical protein